MAFAGSWLVLSLSVPVSEDDARWAPKVGDCVEWRWSVTKAQELEGHSRTRLELRFDPGPHFWGVEIDCVAELRGVQGLRVEADVVE